MPANPDTNTTYTLSGKFNNDGTEYITTLTPDDGTATAAVIPLMTAASDTADGEPGLVPKASAGDQAKFLKADGTWATPSNTDKYQRLYPSTNDVEYPITSRYNTTTGKSYYAEYGRYNVGVTLNPAKQTITAPGGFIGTADAAKSVPWSGVTGKLNATASEAGLIKVSSVNTSAVTVNAESTNAGRYYSVELNSDGKAIVNVPWSDTNTDTGATSVEVAGTGNAITTASYDSASRKLTLTKGATYNNYSLPKATSAVLGGVKIGDNITVDDGTISLTKSDVTTALGYTPPSTDKDTGATSITVSGSGNAVTSATYDASTRTITLTKGATYNNYSHPAGSGASKKSGFYKFSTDGTSHISEVTAVTKADITGLGIPGTDTNTAHAHTAGAGLTVEGSGDISGTTTYSLAASGVTAGTYGPTADVSGTNNTTINVPQITVDEYGRVTSVTNRVYTSKNTDVNTTYSAGTGLKLEGTTFNHTNAVTAKTTYEQSTAAPGYGGTFKIAEPKYDAQGHITEVKVSTITMPSKQTIPTSFTIAANGAGDGVVLLEKQNGNNAVTYNVSHEKMLNSPDDLTVNKYTSENSTTSISGSGDSGVIKIPQITVDEYGHVKKAFDESVTITLPTVPTTLKNPQTLTFGSQTYDGSSAKTITAADLGLSNALHFKGVLESLPATTTNYVDGDVVLVGKKEYVCSSLKWVELGDESSFSLKDHTHNYAGSSSAGGAATSANKVNSSLSIQLNGGTATVFDGSATKSINITPSAIGAAASSHGTHVSYGTTATAVGSTASAGSAASVSRSDHTHSLSKSAVTTALGYTPPTSDTTYSIVTKSTDGLVPMFDAADGTIDSDSTDWVLTNNNGTIGWYKLPANAFKNDNTVYTHPSHTAKSSGLYKITVDALGHVSAATAVAKSDITGLGIPGSDTNFYHTRVYSSGLKISTGTGVSDMYVPGATGTQSGVVIMHPAANCTTFTSDDSTCTVAAVKKAVTLFTNDYAPTKTGGGASGTWGISITGSAGSVAWGNVTGKPSTFTPSSHSHSVTYKKASTSTAKAASSGTIENAPITPSGTISTPIFTGDSHNHTFTADTHNHSFTGKSHNHTLTPSTTDVYSITSVGTMFTATVSGEVLVLTAGTAPTRSSVIKAYTGMSIAAATQGGSIANKVVTGTIGDKTATGTISTPTFTGNEIEHNHTFKGSEHSHSITLTDTIVTAS